jgi:hypothetical protein
MGYDEIWKPIRGYEGMYEISSKGRVKSLIKGKNKILSLKGGGNYAQLWLSKQNTKHRHYVHRLVAIAFLKNNGNKKQVNHINGIKRDNRVENLEWCTREENMRHAANNNLMSKGEKHWKNLLTNKQREEIIELKKEGGRRYGRKELALKYNVSVLIISKTK